MVFSSAIFLFFFLPIVLAVYFYAPKVARNTILLGASLLFYAWGEPFFVLLMLASIFMNYLFGLVIAKSTGSLRNISLLFAVAGNLGILAYYKYGLFIVENIEPLLKMLDMPIQFKAEDLPLGISFFTFQAISYIVDIYRGQAKVQTNPLKVALYISLFPQLIAGPIVRYNTIVEQLSKRTSSLDDVGEGIARFIIGLGKKVLIANVVGEMADKIFALPVETLSTPTAWLGITCYSLQIYFDFSGYSDMAIGLGRIFGFHFPENFNYPYISSSIREFWRRWHISLSTWFRDYLYIPLGGSRGGNARTAFNLITVFFLCGLWHGASWTFVVWGLYHGAFLALERTPFGKLLERIPSVFRHAYVILVFMVGWVLFRAETFEHATYYLRAMAGFGGEPLLINTWQYYANDHVLFTIFIGVIASGPIWQTLFRFYAHHRKQADARTSVPIPLRLTITFALLAILFLSTLQIASDTYNPFIYFRF